MTSGRLMKVYHQDILMLLPRYLAQSREDVFSDYAIGTSCSKISWGILMPIYLGDVAIVMSPGYTMTRTSWRPLASDVSGTYFGLGCHRILLVYRFNDLSELPPVIIHDKGKFV
ncbi:hypothetical protein BKA69DRAFT_1129803 [Paraphysoderma sedebokerense]|nr:hypothetical protein BKA69DRAFT_1129803 [Paraphysoderma sedebokerense]